eukprot:scaffold59015_cov31-Tisochrysis_lutea.AAC.8
MERGLSSDDDWALDALKMRALARQLYRTLVGLCTRVAEEGLAGGGGMSRSIDLERVKAREVVHRTRDAQARRFARTALAMRLVAPCPGCKCRSIAWRARPAPECSTGWIRGSPFASAPRQQRRVFRLHGRGCKSKCPPRNRGSGCRRGRRSRSPCRLPQRA